VTVSQENIALCGLQGFVEVLLGGIEAAPEGPYAIVVANINAPIIMDIAPAAFAHLKPGGYYVTTGFTERSVMSARQAFTEAGFHMVDLREAGDWRCAICRKP
jgi:ribosomal protein L11 methyltransferase